MRCSLQMWVALKEVGRARAGLGLDTFVRFELVAIGGGRCDRELFERSFEEIR